MNQSRREIIENFFKKANLAVMVDKSVAVEISCRKGDIIIDVKNPLLLMSLGIDLNMLKKRDRKDSVIRKAIKDLGFKIKIRYKFFEIEF